MTVPIVSVAHMRALETAALAAGISEVELQRRAGHAVAEEAAHLLTPGGRVVVLVGHGNNGRDGAVAAEWLARRGYAVQMALAPRHAVRPDELALSRSLGVTTFGSERLDDVTQALARAEVAIDGLAGIGTRGALREPLAGLVRALNQAHGPRVLAIDVPSGMDADDGELPGEVVCADVTVTLGAVKQGLLRFPAATRVGRLVFRDIGLPASDVPYRVLEPGGLVPPRPLDAHKYRFGRVLVVAGSDHFLGAAVLCSGGALRAGAGLVTVGSTRAVRQTVAAHLPEATFTRVDVEDVEQLRPYLESDDAVVIGPGLGRGPAQTALVRGVLEAHPRGQVVLDADALFALAEMPEWWKLLSPETILTPHAGELARLTGPPPPTEAPWETARRLARQWQCILVAKGPFTCVADADGQVAVWPRANPALATGGTGDVLAGLCGGFVGQGSRAADAARLAVAVHALAAESLLERRGWRTLLASDLFEEIPAVLARLANATRR
ncbi:MAG: NAD(P)H-hydrate dehydratase [Chloroflexota bacterium]|nr:NAD(P)H-hydrate dehydratase [Chloroflexota bacterium]